MQNRQKIETCDKLNNLLRIKKMKQNNISQLVK